MQPLRRLARTHARLAILIALLLVALRLAVPVGFMPVFADGTLTIAVCSGANPGTTIEITIPGKPDHGENDAGFDAAPCAFASLAMPMLGGTDPVLLLSALLFAVAAALRRTPPPLRTSTTRLRPPLRGPPLHI